MAEYITGRIRLSDCDLKKNISDIKDKAKQLTFVLDERKRILVDEVPAVYGVRCGAVVSGYLRAGQSELQSVRWPKGTKPTATCLLKDLMKENGIVKATDTLVFETECLYCTKTVKVDTKDFGLPQTRMRTYMFVWRPEDGDVNDDLGYYFEKIVHHLKSPVRHSLQSFILQVDHDLIRVFREALRGPPGRQTMRSVCLEPYYWTSASTNLPHNKNPRVALGLEDTARFITNWHAHGKKQVPPHYWLEYLKCNYQREMDFIDILHASALRDAEAHDSNFSSFYWNISQNATKEKHRSSRPGIAGCITPGGDFFLPQEGRPILVSKKFSATILSTLKFHMLTLISVLQGCEKLMIQGIPYFRLALGAESEVQLGDLAGNAMSLTVVCATILSALTCRQLRKEALVSGRSVDDTLSSLIAKSATEGLYGNLKELLGSTNSEALANEPGATSATAFFAELASLAKDAIESSIWCTCETSGTSTTTSCFLECRVCRVSCCRNCICSTAGYNLESHDTRDVEISMDTHDSRAFQTRLRSIVPSILRFTSEGIEEIVAVGSGDDKHRVRGLSVYNFRLHRIKRDRMKWIIVFYARRSGEAIAEFKITVGELRRQTKRDGDEVDVGMKGELTSYLPAITQPVVFSRLLPCAVVCVSHKERNVVWKGQGESKQYILHVRGEGSTPSARTEVGLTDEAAIGLQASSQKKFNAKIFAAAKQRGEERRWLYPTGWKIWPGKSFDIWLFYLV
jgi:hypothetical protein